MYPRPFAYYNRALARDGRGRPLAIAQAIAQISLTLRCSKIETDRPGQRSTSIARISVPAKSPRRSACHPAATR